MIEPFFFGPHDAFALFHSALNGSSNKVIVICQSIFDEHRRCYKALADFGNACAAEGFNVLRLDYPGTAEAGGELQEFTAKDWVEAINLAIEEGLALSGAEEVYLIGVRFGATLAAQIRHPGVTRYLFWDPVVSGEEYMEFIDKVNRDSEKSHKKLLLITANKQRLEHYRCFEMSSEMRQTISELSMTQLLESKLNVFVVISAGNKVPKKYLGVDYTYMDYAYTWPIKHQGLLTPKPVLRTLMEIVKR